MSMDQFFEALSEYGPFAVAVVVLALTYYKLNEDIRADNKEREKESRERENLLISKMETVNDTNRSLAQMGTELTRTNKEIAMTNSLLAEDMKKELCNIDTKLDSLIQSKSKGSN